MDECLVDVGRHHARPTRDARKTQIVFPALRRLISSKDIHDNGRSRMEPTKEMI